jgi:hypothetical protein
MRRLVVMVLMFVGGDGVANTKPSDVAEQISAETSTETGASIYVTENWWGPVVVTGSDFGSYALVIVTVYDVWGGFIAQHSVRASRDFCNSKGICWGGGRITTDFTVQEIGAERHALCATIQVVAYDTSTGEATPPFARQLLSCIG